MAAPGSGALLHLLPARVPVRELLAAAGVPEGQGGKQLLVYACCNIYAVTYIPV